VQRGHRNAVKFDGRCAALDRHLPSYHLLPRREMYCFSVVRAADLELGAAIAQSNARRYFTLRYVALRSKTLCCSTAVLATLSYTLRRLSWRWASTVLPAVAAAAVAAAAAL